MKKLLFLLFLWCTPLWGLPLDANTAITEGTTSYLDLTFYDEDGNTEVPVSVVFWVIDLTTQTVLQDVTTICSPGTSDCTVHNYRATLTAAANRIYKQGKTGGKEAHQIIVLWSYGNNPYYPVISKYTYAVEDILGIEVDCSSTCTPRMERTRTPTATP
jgi:hypothetical protein